MSLTLNPFPDEQLNLAGHRAEYKIATLVYSLCFVYDANRLASEQLAS
jgi:hypothetical protein